MVFKVWLVMLGLCVCISWGGCELGEVASFKISVGSTPHTNYGLGYPVTYKFSIPAAAVNLTAWQKKTLPAAWTQLTEKTTDDFFNGIDAVRFDYTNDFAYVSVAFGSDSDDIYVLFKDASGDPVAGVSFIEICEYYNDRKAVVTLTADDWAGITIGTDVKAMDAARTRNIWLTGGLYRFDSWEASHWATMQNRLDLGYLEVASHSYNHQHTPYDDYDVEIGDSAQAIRDNLDLPALYKKGTTEYVWAWGAPYGNTDATLRAKLGQYKYLADVAGTGYGSFPSWDAANGVYNYWNRYGFAENLSEAQMNAQWDTDYAAGNIYHLGMHAGLLTWTPGSKILNHFDYIKDKKDVWYVGMGALFAYHYTQERGEVSVSMSYERRYSR